MKTLLQNKAFTSLKHWLASLPCFCPHFLLKWYLFAYSGVRFVPSHLYFRTELLYFLNTSSVSHSVDLKVHYVIFTGWFDLIIHINTLSSKEDTLSYCLYLLDLYKLVSNIVLGPLRTSCLIIYRSINLTMLWISYGYWDILVFHLIVYCVTYMNFYVVFCE